ncbi:hypothetical protein Tco_1499178 [Tanacetum coccineum]
MQNGRVMVQNVQGRQNRVQGNNARGAVAAGNGGAQYRAGNANAGQGKTIKCYNCNGIENGVDLDEGQLLFLAGGQTNTFDDKVNEGPVQDMTQNKDNIFQADQCDVFDSDVDEAPTTQSMFMANLSSADLVYDEAGPSYDSDTLFEVQDHDYCLDNMNESHEEHEIHNDVQPNDVVDSDTEYTSNSNIISYEQYVQDNEDQVVHSDVSSVPNDAVMIITNDIYEQDTQGVTSNNTVNASLTVELARYKELVEVYEKRAKFELNERELMIDTQMRMIIKYRNVKEEYLQKELHSVEMQLNSTLNHNKLIREEGRNRVAIGYKNPFYLSKAKQVQLALYNGHDIVKTNHARALVHDSKDTLEIAETTRKQMIAKMKDPECVKKKIFWSDDLLKMKAKALKEKAKSAKPITAMTVYPPNTPAKLVDFIGGFSNVLFKTIKEHLEEIQKALINKIKEIKEVFEQMKGEVDQHAVDKKCDDIERTNLLIENENIIVECLSKDVFYTATYFVLTVSRFSDMHDAYTVAQKRIAELEAEIFNLTQKI